jgi:hypothetical protein
MEFWGEFETHVTVSIADAAAWEALRAWAKSRHLKLLHIQLERGTTVSQPMLTFRSEGNLSGELEAAQRLREALAADGFAVTRIKIEANPENLEVPLTEADARRHPADRYFEHHIKLLLEPTTDLRTLAGVAERHAAHLSRNALRCRADGLEERFVTQRCWSAGRVEARHGLERLREALAPFQFSIVSLEEEYVVYDSNIEIDAGWIDGGR